MQNPSLAHWNIGRLEKGLESYTCSNIWRRCRYFFHTTFFIKINGLNIPCRTIHCIYLLDSDFKQKKTASYDNSQILQNHKLLPNVDVLGRAFSVKKECVLNRENSGRFNSCSANEISDLIAAIRSSGSIGKIIKWYLLRKILFLT